MDPSRYTTMQEMLGTKEGQFGSLSIVVRLRSPRVSRTRATLAAVGLAPGGGAGHAAIVYEFEGHVRAMFTSPEHPYELGRADRVPGVGELVVRTRELEEADVEQFDEAMKEISAREELGLALWTPTRTSAAFAAELWLRTFGESLDHRTLGLSTPASLARSIRQSAERERSITRSERSVLELTVSERISELMSGQTRSAGRSLGL